MRSERTAARVSSKRLRTFFGIDHEWERPLPQEWVRRDTYIALLFFLASALALECHRALGLPPGGWSRLPMYASIAVGAAPLVIRRRFPVAVMVFESAHMFVFGMAQPIVMSNLGMQAVYFFAIFSALAWARDRRAVTIATGAILIFMFGWLAVQWSIASSLDEAVRTMSTPNGDRSGALFGPAAGAVLYGLLINVMYFFTAVGTGANSWRGARAYAQTRAQARQLACQQEQLARQAVLNERMRIARELHDVVAHHVSAMGVQAAAARKLLAKDTEKATQALSNVELQSREAVTQMRQLLGTLRSESAAGLDGSAKTDGPADADRAPEPSLSAIPQLVESVRSRGLVIDYDDRLGSIAERVPGSVGHSLYRTVQEALTNVQRHSTAARASVVLRDGSIAGGTYVEVEILDAGRPRTGTSGSGLGVMGVRERVRAHHGTAEIGPRVTGGYRVRVRIPLDARDAHAVGGTSATEVAA